MQRDIVQRPGTTVGHADARPVARTSLPGNLLAPSAGRRFVEAALTEWTGLGLPAAVGFSERLADDAAVVVSELVTNAVVHAGTNVELLCRLEEATEDEVAALVLEVSDHHPARAVRSERREGGGPADAAESGVPAGPADYGRGLQLVGTLAERWGITYRTGLKTVWARLPVDDWNPFPEPSAEPGFQQGLRAAELLAPTARRALRDDADWAGRGALSFLAEASDLLAGQLDEDIVAALAGQLLVPRLADWCAIWLEPENGGPAAVPRLASVWHRDEAETGQLRTVLEQGPIRLPERVGTGPVSMPWPGGEEDGEKTDEHAESALAYRITSGGRTLGAVLLGREGTARVPDEVTALIEDFVRRVGLAVGAARAYTRQATISRILQRALLPGKVADIPGVTSSLVYEPSDDGVVGGDFYDIFPCPGDRWCFVLGDVQGSGPEAAVVTGLARPWLRLLAREGFGVGEVLDRLNRLLLDDAMEAAEAAALMVAAAGGQQTADTGQSRFLSLLYGELVPLPGGGVRCTVASAGHPLPLLLRPDGQVRPAAEPQMLLGIFDDVAYESQSFELAPGDSLLCVTDGVTERRSGTLMFDDGDGLAQALADCAGLSADGIADRIKRAVHEFAERPPDDDLALLVLQAG
ncbi:MULTISPECIES: ATP-binding SpoIIE family protein phosphatase [unclassified Streptomyces]|uniref:ATP-binding SpoIIE family protein phosphatase n=1 Tax=unclassified Streptomyces TaxID=2593676 RepID=UPI0033F892D6